MRETAKNAIISSIAVKELLLSENYLDQIARIADTVISAYKNGNKVLLCGNGGSGSDCLHIEGELVGRFNRERKGLPAIALSSGFAALTAIGNDYGYADIFRRGVEAHGKKGDVLFAFSTSGNSENIISAVAEAKKSGIATVGFLGKDGGTLKQLVDIALVVPSDEAPRIQECHILIGHIVCGLVEGGVFDE